MKNEPKTHDLPEGPVPADAFKAFFQTLENPAALCDQRLNVLAANPAFDALLGGAQLQAIAVDVPTDGRSSEIEVEASTGQRVMLNFSRRGDIVAVMARQLKSAAEATVAVQARALLEQARVEQALLELGREVAGSASEEELVAVVARGVKELFPGRSFCIRIADPRSLGLTSLYAEGRLREGARDVLVLKRSAVEKTHLNLSNVPVGKVKVTEDEVPLLFMGSQRGICAPLVASGQLFGVINVEYPAGMTADLVSDDRILIQLANQVAVGIRNAKLIDELTFVRKYLEELLEHANALILTTNRDRKVIVFNKAISNLTGLPKEQVLGRDVLELVPESERMRFQAVLDRALRGEPASNFETRLMAAKNREIRVAFATSAVPTTHGDVEGVIVIGQDITVIRELEKQVIQAEKLASLGQLAASVVHEINNPMTAVHTYADAMWKRTLGQPTADKGDAEKLKKIVDNSERVLRFTRDLVSYARPSQDKKSEKVDVHKMLDLAVTFCDHVVQQHGVKVERLYQPVPEISAIHGNMVQVFVNLITNACHAMQPGGLVRIRTEAAAGQVLVKVEDSGTGIPEDVLPRIFDPFFTTKAEGKGTGLGLSIVHAIVEKHGGTIEVKSSLGTGTTFIVKLPA